MLKVDEDIYLGEVTLKDGKNSSNIRARVAKGIGSINQITNILDSVTFGRFKVEIGLLLRQSVFLSRVLFSSEAWYNVTNKEISELEKINRILMLKILQAPVTTPKIAVFLETGTLRI